MGLCPVVDTALADNDDELTNSFALVNLVLQSLLGISTSSSDGALLAFWFL